MGAPLKTDATATAAAPRVLAVASHPIQYQAPWFRALAQRKEITFSVVFIQLPDAHAQGKGFGVPFTWDVPLLEGYEWQQAQDVRGRGGLGGFFSTRLADPDALLRRLAPDVMLLTGWHTWPLVQLLAAARRAAIPVVMRGESNALRSRPWAIRRWHRMLLARCAAFLPIGRASRDFYLQYGISEDRLFDAPYFVDNTRFQAAAREALSRRAELRRRWNIPPRACCFCFAGKLEPKKRLFDLLAALKLAVQRTAAPMHLLVVGTGEQMHEAEQYVRRHRLPVTFAGFLNQSEIASAYTAADALVLPSDYGETWGLVVNEAMACGRTAIVSDRVGCAADLIIDGVTGSLFPFGDVEVLALRLAAFATDRRQLSQLGERARTRVLRGYTVERAVQGTLDAVARVARRP